MSQILFNITAGTHVGCVRTNNEDNFVLNADLRETDWFLPQDASKPIELGEYGCLMVVADGMGGANCGEVASAIAVDEVKKHFDQADKAQIVQSDIAIEEFLCQTIVDADAVMKERAQVDSETRGMGTTIVMAWIVDGVVHLAWCGDSRAYVYNKVGGIKQISKDHSYVQQLVDQGALAPEDMFGHPQSNIITRCLGDFPSPALPDYCIYTLQEGDTLMLCSDGLCAYVTDKQIEAEMRLHEDDVVATRNALIQNALDVGGFDNVTVAVMTPHIQGAEPQPETEEPGAEQPAEEAKAEETENSEAEEAEDSKAEEGAENTKEGKESEKKEAEKPKKKAGLLSSIKNVFKKNK